MGWVLVVVAVPEEVRAWTMPPRKGAKECFPIGRRAVKGRAESKGERRGATSARRKY